MNLRQCVVVWMGLMAIGCEPDESLEEAGMMITGGGAGVDATVYTSDAASAMTADGSMVAPGSTGGGGNAGGGNSEDASTDGLDAGTNPGHLDASDPNQVVIGPSVRRDSGIARWDPDAQGPVLNAEGQAACLMLTDNICNRVAECQASVSELTEPQRMSAFEACRISFWRGHNCNRAIRTTSDFATCSESTKTRDCTTVFLTDFGTSCVDTITFEP